MRVTRFCLILHQYYLLTIYCVFKITANLMLSIQICFRFYRLGPLFANNRLNYSRFQGSYKNSSKKDKEQKRI